MLLRQPARRKIARAEIHFRLGRPVALFPHGSLEAPRAHRWGINGGKGVRLVTARSCLVSTLRLFVAGVSRGIISTAPRRALRALTEARCSLFRVWLRFEARRCAPTFSLTLSFSTSLSLQPLHYPPRARRENNAPTAAAVAVPPLCGWLAFR